MRRAKRKTTRKKPVKKPRVRKGAKAWMATETATLKKAYKTQTTTQIAKTLRRSVSSVKAKARTLGLKKRRPKRVAAKKTTARRKVAVRKTVTRRKPARKLTARKKTTARKRTTAKRRTTKRK
jgi:hypothetical protein